MLVDVKKEEEVGYIILNRTEKLNALNPQLLEELGDRFFSLAHDQHIKVIVISSAAKSFCAGADLEALTTMTKRQVGNFIKTGQKLFDAIENTSKITIAAIHGHTLGAGFELACACDLRIAADDTKLGQPEISLGLTPGMGASYRLTKLISPAAAKQLLLTGQSISAKHAHELGLLTTIVKKSALKNQTQSIAQNLAKYDQKTVQAVKSLLKTSTPKLEAAHFCTAWAKTETQNKIHAFLRK